MLKPIAKPLSVAIALTTVAGCATAETKLRNSPNAGDSFVHLFEWPYEAIAQECEQELVHSPIKAIQISPVNEVIDHPTWWARYQPVTFDNFNSRSGDETAMKDMLARCDAAGINVYADVVINHTSDYGGEGIGTGGTPWKIKQHPGLSANHYHNLCTIKDYTNTYEVQNCQLGALPDLDTANPYVQKMLNHYIQRLASFGFAGFRIDAAKHISPKDLAAILEGVEQWRFLEVIGNPAAPADLQPPAYAHLGAVTDFSPAYQFQQVLETNDWRKLKLDTVNYEAVDFVDNHDTERHGAKAYQHGATDALYRQVQIALLLGSTGYSKILSGYKYDDKDAAAPSQAPCSAPWQCWHRDSQILTAARLRKLLADEPVSDLEYSNNGNALIIERGDKLLAILNNGPKLRIEVMPKWQGNKVIDELSNKRFVLHQQLDVEAGATLLLRSE